MACFTFDGSARRLLAACIQIGFEGAECSDEEEATIAAMLEELEAGAGPVEITVAAIENDEGKSDFDPKPRFSEDHIRRSSESSFLPG